MKILIIEYITGGGGSGGQSLPPSMADEGDHMMNALTRDLSDLPGITVTYCRDPHFLPLEHGRPIWVDRTPSDGPWTFWSKHIRQADAVLPIAPETEGLLLCLAKNIEQCGVRLLGSTQEAIALTTSKQTTADCLHAHGLPVIPTFRPDQPPPESSTGWIVKPDDGAGVKDVVYAPDPDALHATLSEARQGSSMIVQPFIPGIVASLCVIYQDQEATVLSANIIGMRRDGRSFAYTAIEVGAMNDQIDLFRPLAETVGKAVPGLRGYTGIDLIQDGETWRVMEINPRITTSYTGLREALGSNPAEHLLRPFLPAAVDHA